MVYPKKTALYSLYRKVIETKKGLVLSVLSTVTNIQYIAGIFICLVYKLVDV